MSTIISIIYNFIKQIWYVGIETVITAVNDETIKKIYET